MTRASHRIAVIEGDGIGREVIPAGIRVIEAAARRFGFRCEFVGFDWSCERYAATGRMMPEDGLQQLRAFDAIYLGAVGYPGVPDHVSLWGLLLPIRREFDLYANIRPIRLFEGVPCPLAGRKPGEIDFVVVRENTEGEYSDIGGRSFAGTEREFIVQQAVHSRVGVDRILRHAFETARTRARRKLTLATKSNGILHAMPYWDERFVAMAAEYPDVEADKQHIDILAAHFVQYPDRFSVVVGSNLFGDILSDLGPAVVGGIGIAASANLDPQRRFPRCSSRCTVPHRILRGRGLPILSPRSGQQCRCWNIWASWRLRRRSCRPSSLRCALPKPARAISEARRRRTSLQRRS